MTNQPTYTLSIAPMFEDGSVGDHVDCTGPLDVLAVFMAEQAARLSAGIEDDGCYADALDMTLTDDRYSRDSPEADAVATAVVLDEVRGRNDSADA